MTMHRTRLKDELTRDEGKKLHVYKDTENNYTIGIGHLVGHYPRILDITESECNALYNYDADSAEDVASSLIRNPAVWSNEARSRAVVNMAFNLGYRLKEFKDFLAAIDVGDWEKAKTEMLDSKWAKQVGARADRLANMVLTGIDPSEA